MVDPPGDPGSDRAAIRAVTVAAFDSAAEADLVDALRNDPSWIDGLSIVTTTPDGTVVGHALLTRCWVGGVPALCLAPCSVLPEHQRTGAGSAAIVTALEAARAQGEAFVVVLGHPDYYPRFGFRRGLAGRDRAHSRGAGRGVDGHDARSHAAAAVRDGPVRAALRDLGACLSLDRRALLSASDSDEVNAAAVEFVSRRM